MVLKAQGHLAEAEPLLREVLGKRPGAQLQRFQRDFGQWILSHTLLDFCWLISFLMTELVLQCSWDGFGMSWSKGSKVAFIFKASHGKCLESSKVH